MNISNCYHKQNLRFGIYYHNILLSALMDETSIIPTPTTQLVLLEIL